VAIPQLSNFTIDPEIYKSPTNELKGIPLLLRYDMIVSQPHRHFPINFSQSMDEALAGGKLKCKVCLKILTKEDLNETDLERCKFYGSVGPIVWRKESPAFQDIETIKAGTKLWYRKFGEWVPCQSVQTNWEQGAYLENDAPFESTLPPTSLSPSTLPPGFTPTFAGTNVPVSSIVNTAVPMGDTSLTEVTEVLGSHGDDLTMFLILIGFCYRAQKITAQERGVLKELLIRQNDTKLEEIYDAIRQFQQKKDLNDLVCTFKRVSDVITKITNG